MPAAQREIKIIWLMILTMIGVGAWTVSQYIVTYICGAAFVLSVMQYVDQFQFRAQLLKGSTPLELTSKIPLYVASMIALLGIFINADLLIALGLSAWIYYFLKWIRRIESYLLTLQHRPIDANSQTAEPDLTPKAVETSESLVSQIQQWIFHGNPVLKTAVVILLIGVILLLRFAAEHWQFNLAAQLFAVANISLALVGCGVYLSQKNRYFALALQGLGIAGLWLSLLFAYDNQIMTSLLVVGFCFALISSLCIYLSLKQDATELAMMAICVAYIAPFTLNHLVITTPQLLGYYIVINLVVAVLSSLKPWKYLSQMALLATTLIAGGYGLAHVQTDQTWQMAVLICVHLMIFIWLGFRYSQLLNKHDFSTFKLKPVLDLALIFIAPLVAYTGLYLLYHGDASSQASWSITFAILFAGLWWFSKKGNNTQFIAQHYLALSLIFLAITVPTLFVDQWRAAIWAIQSVFILVIAVRHHVALAQYLSSAFALMAILSCAYAAIEYNNFYVTVYVIVALSFLFSIVWMQLQLNQLPYHSVLRVSHWMQACAASVLLMFALNDYLEMRTWWLTLSLITLLYVGLQTVLQRYGTMQSWLLVKWVGLLPICVAYILLSVDQMTASQPWQTALEQYAYVVLGGILSWIWLMPLMSVTRYKEISSAGVIVLLACAGANVLPQMPYVGLAVFPLLLCLYSYLNKQNTLWLQFWQSYSSLALLVFWIISSQMLAEHAFKAYVWPVFNPFDAISIVVAIALAWVISLQVKAGRDTGLMSVCMVLSTLWLASYVLLRALHIYLDTPFNHVSIWTDPTVQFSLTVLWVSLASISMTLASRLNVKSVWLLGGSILVLVTLKLVLFDLSQVGTVLRVGSFLGAGVVMLIIAYIAPMPETEKNAL